MPFDALEDAFEDALVGAIPGRLRHAIALAVKKGFTEQEVRDAVIKEEPGVLTVLALAAWYHRCANARKNLPLT